MRGASSPLTYLAFALPFLAATGPGCPPSDVPPSVLPALCAAIREKPQTAELAAMLDKGVRVLDRTRYLGTGLLFEMPMSAVRQLEENLRARFEPRPITLPPPNTGCPVVLVDAEALQSIPWDLADAAVYMELSNPFVNTLAPLAANNRIGILAVVSSSASAVITATESTWFWVVLEESASGEWGVSAVEYLGVMEQ